MKLTWERVDQLSTDDLDVMALWLMSDIPEEHIEKTPIAAATQVSKRKWIISVQGRTNRNQKIIAGNARKAEEKCEELLIDIMEEEIGSRKSLIDAIKQLEVRNGASA